LQDAVDAFALLRVGGIMAFDDYEWGWNLHRVNTPRLAIDAFLRTFAPFIKVVGKGWQVWVQKTGDPQQLYLWTGDKR
jgi:hypothetical protein